MTRMTISGAGAAVSLCLLLPGAVIGSEEGRAKQLCREEISNVYGVSDFRQVWGEQIGNHKFKIHGKVKVDDHRYPFDCKVKHGHVKSYAYHGPHDRHRDREDDDESNLGTALAVGAGLAIVAALAASQSDDGGKPSRLQVSKSVLEDDCHDALQYRIRDEHDYTARVHLSSSRIDGHDLVGDARVKYNRDHPHHSTFRCHFDGRGRVMDSQYRLY